MEGNNMSGKIAHLRDTFLEAEKEYLEELKRLPGCEQIIMTLNKKSGSQLALMAMEKIKSIENGLIKPEDLERVEAEITLILASIQDRERELTKEKTRDYSEEMGM